ncbi:MAG: energy transducer TonB [Lysobacterales bacterium]
MRKGIVAYLISAGLYACASVPQAYFASDILVVSEDQLKVYWQPKKETIKFRESPGFKPVAGCGYVIVQHLIDSNGNVFNPEIIESVPAGVYDRSALKVLTLIRYIPADTNPEKVPVKVSRKTTFLTKGQECASHT